MLSRSIVYPEKAAVFPISLWILRSFLNSIMTFYSSRLTTLFNKRWKKATEFLPKNASQLIAIKIHDVVNIECASREMGEIKLISLDITLSLIFIMPFYNLVQIILFH
jgi:hypothetical protein